MVNYMSGVEESVVNWWCGSIKTVEYFTLLYRETKTTRSSKPTLRGCWAMVTLTQHIIVSKDGSYQDEEASKKRSPEK